MKTQNKMDLMSYSLLFLAAFIGFCGKSCHGGYIKRCPRDIVPRCPHWAVTCTDDMWYSNRYAEVSDGTMCYGCPVCLPKKCPSVPEVYITAPRGCNNVKYYKFYALIDDKPCFAGESYQCN